MGLLFCNKLWPYKTRATKSSEFADNRSHFQSWSSRNTRRIYFLIAILLILAFFILGLHIFVFRDRMKYNRNLDSQLYQYIEISEAARKLPKKGRLFCWVQTSELYHDTRAIAINETWIHRCDHGQLFTSMPFNDSRIPYSTLFAGIPDSYYNLFYKSRFAFHYIYRNISSEFDWYYKADDDTYLVVENLRAYLATLNPDEPHYLGYVLKPYLEHGYNGGGAGYVLSRAALKLFNERLYGNETLCPDDIYEDLGIGSCLANIGIYPRDTRNSKAQNRFNTFSPSETFHQNVNESWKMYPEKTGFASFADDVISFHHLSPDDIRLFDYLIYRLNRSNF